MKIKIWSRGLLKLHFMVPKSAIKKRKGYSYSTCMLAFVCYSYGSLLRMLSFAKFRHFSALQITSLILCPFCYSYWIFFKGILAHSCTLLVFCYSYGSFFNHVKLGILLLISRNMALKIQNGIIHVIRKTIKNNPKKSQDSIEVLGSQFERW